MQVGDILVCLNDTEYGSEFTTGKHYIIFKIDKFFGNHEENIGWINNNNNSDTFFKESQATNKDWEYLYVIRKLKLKQIQNYEI